MGNFDPEEGTPDDDKQVGNIFNVMMYYPNHFTFTLIGKLNPDNYDEEAQKLVNAVKETAASVLSSSSSSDEAISDEKSLINNMEVSIIPRGKKFVKISLTVMVNSGNDISMIYDSLSSVEDIVMKF